MQEEKRKALESVFGQIEKQYGAGAVMRLGEKTSVEVEAIPTGSMSLDIALGIGGVPRGRIIEIYGPESSGKTTVALHIVAEAQKLGGEAAFIDAEHALDPVYAEKLGVRIDDLIVSQPDTANRLLKLPNSWYVQVRLMLLLLTRLRLLFQSRRLRVLWAIPTWGFRQGLCPRLSESLPRL